MAMNDMVSSTSTLMMAMNDMVSSASKLVTWCRKRAGEQPRTMKKLT